LATAVLMAARGACVWLMARRQDRLESALDSVRKAGSSYKQHGMVTADVTDFKAVEAAVSKVVESSGSPDILINSAGEVYPCLFKDVSTDVVRHLMDVNFMGMVNVTKACLPSMIARRTGSIVNISSVYGFIGGYGYAAYCASKYAVRGFSDALRVELKPLGIRVSVVFPQNTDTPQLDYENSLKTKEMKLIDNTSVMTVESVAKSITGGIRRGDYMIIPGREGRLVIWLNSNFSALTRWYMDSLVRRALREKDNKT